LTLSTELMQCGLFKRLLVASLLLNIHGLRDNHAVPLTDASAFHLFNEVISIQEKNAHAYPATGPTPLTRGSGRAAPPLAGDRTARG
jgi:hypothetical protein